MKAIRLLTAAVSVWVVILALPAAAHPGTNLVQISTWTLNADIRGLDQVDSSRVEALWNEFVAGVPAHSACLLASPPRFESKPDLAHRAAYSPSRRVLYVKPHDLDRLVVFHELAHHLDFTCGASETIGDDLRRAQGLPMERDWWKEGPPTGWPAEYFANAVAIALGESSRHNVAPATVEVVEQWMGRTEAVPPTPRIVPRVMSAPSVPGLF